MKFGTSVWSLPNDWDLKTIFKTAKETGYDGVELALAESGEFSLNTTEKDCTEIKKLAESMGIELYSIATALFWFTSLTSADKALREKAKGIAKKQLELAACLGCDTVLIVPGAVTPETDYETAYNLTLEWLSELKPFAESLKVTIGLENVWNKFLLSPLEMRNLIDGQNSDFVGAYFDVGNIVHIGFPEQWIKTLGKRIKKIHVKDFCRNGDVCSFVPMLMGDTDYSAVNAALKEIGYNGWITAETSFSEKAPEASAKYTLDAMKKIFN